MTVVSDFVAQNIPGCERGFGSCSEIGFETKGKLVAGVVYHNWNPEAGVVELSSASTTRRWLTKARLHQIFEYPFNQVGCQLCVARISETNVTACRIWRALGANEYLIPRLRGADEAEIIFTLTCEAWAEFKKRM